MEPARLRMVTLSVEIALSLWTAASASLRMASKNTYTISKKVTSTQHGSNGPLGEWAVWVNHDEEGVGDTSDVPSFGDIDVDNEGVFGTRHRAVIDLSHGLGQALGKQLPMTAIYRVKGIKVGIRPVNDTQDNYQGGVMFGGNIKYVFPNKHNIDAIQAARKVERLAESSSIDSDSDVFGTERSGYNGFRFGWRTESDVYMATREGFSEGDAVEGGVASWCLYSDDGALGILDNYATWKGLVPQVGTEHRNLWNTRCGSPSKMMWNCTWVSDTGAQGQADFHKQWGAENHLPVLGGLLVLDVIYSSTDQPNELLKPSDDDYVVFVEVDVEGWEAF